MTRTGYKVLVLTAIAVLLTISNTTALDKETTRDRRLDAKYSMVGVRLGAWVDQGDANVIETGDEIDADLPGTGFFSELFYAHRFTPALMGEISLGVAGRGEATIKHGDDEYIGTINLYPLLFQVKLNTLAGRSRILHPYFTGGGGFVFGRHNTEFIRSVDPFYDSYFAEKTEIDIVWTVGAGIDIAATEQFGLNLSVKYCPITFSDGLAGIDNYSGYSIAVGFSYHVYKNKK